MKRLKRVLFALAALLLLFSALAPGLPGARVRAADPENLALGKKTYASGTEVPWLPPELAVDGETEMFSRWASDISDDAWIYVDLGKIRDIDHVNIHFQTPAKEYMLLVSKDAKDWRNPLGEGAVIKTSGEWDAEVETNFELLEARYVKFQGVQSLPGLGYGIYELEVRRLGVRSAAAALTGLPDVEKDQSGLVLPEIKGYALRVAGSTHMAIIGLDGKINAPLCDTEVGLVLELTDKKTGETGLSGSIAVKVPGIYGADPGQNPAPGVLPSLREWHGGSGYISLTEKSRLVLSPADAGALEHIAAGLAEDLETLCGLRPEIVTAQPGQGDIFMALDPALARLGGEGYAFGAEEYISILAPEPGGAYYGGITLLQIVKSSGPAIPRGEARDYPAYEVRGIMLDVSRLFYSMDYLCGLSELLSWYKLNTLHIHLNDDVYAGEDDPGWAFRLESEKFPALTSKNHYTKAEFRQFVLDCMDKNINIIPEFDTPGHSRAFTVLDPSIGEGSHLDLDNPAALEFIKELFSEYIDGDEPVFAGPDIHIGTDEYVLQKEGDLEAFRAYTDSLIKFINEKGKTPHIWSGVKAYAGETPISSDAVASVWAESQGDVAGSLAAGFDVINYSESFLYTVPIVHSRYNIRDAAALYDAWEVRTFKDAEIPAADPRLKGAVSALWNDISAGAGLSEDDTTARLWPISGVLAQKTWAGGTAGLEYAEFERVAQKNGLPPGSAFPSGAAGEDGTVLERDFDTGEYDLQGSWEIAPGILGGALSFGGGAGYLKTGLKDTAFDWTAGFWINTSAGGTIFESDRGRVFLKTGAELLKKEDLIDIYYTGARFWQAENGVLIRAAGSESGGQRVSTTRKYELEGLSVRLSEIEIPAPGGQGIGIGISPQQGGFYGVGVSGLQIRLTLDEKGALHVLVRDASSESSAAPLVSQPLPGYKKGFPADGLSLDFFYRGESLVIKIGSDEIAVPAAFAMNALRDGKAYVSFGAIASDESPEGAAFIVRSVSNGGDGREFGQLAFEKGGRESAFAYALPLGEWTHVVLTGDIYATSLYVNGGEYYERLAEPGKLHTLSLPLERIGGENAFAGKLDSLIVKRGALDLLGLSADLAKGAAVSASGTETPDFPPEKAVDGDGATRWSSPADDGAWFVADLGGIKTVGGVKINFEYAAAKRFRILVSGDGESYVNVLPGDGEYSGAAGPVEVFFPAVEARYVKFQGIEREHKEYGYSFYSFEVHPAARYADEAFGELLLAADTLNERNIKSENGERLRSIAEKYPYFSQADRAEIKSVSIRLADNFGAYVYVLLGAGALLVAGGAAALILRKRNKKAYKKEG